MPCEFRPVSVTSLFMSLGTLKPIICEPWEETLENCLLLDVKL